MFGFGKRRAAVDDSEKYCRAMFVGLEQIYSKPIPNQVFGDPYILGFLQQLTMFASLVSHGGRTPAPEAMADIMAATLDRLTNTPNLGRSIISAAAGIADPYHPLHQNYQVGRNEGSRYVRALMKDEQEAQHEIIVGFRDFVVRNYLS